MATEMRMAELARQSGLSVPTIKFYLREELLQPGRRTSVNQAVYDETHVERLRLIRAMAKVAGLPLSTIREVVQTISSDPSPLDAMAVTQDAMVGEVAGDDLDPHAATLLEEIIAARGWDCEPDSPAYRAAVATLAEAVDEDITMLLERLHDYSRAADEIGRLDVDGVRGSRSLDGMIRGIVMGSILRRSIVDALTLLAQQHHAHQPAPESQQDESQRDDSQRGERAGAETAG